ncbi:beta-ketoacyl synthase N-terminal-like domain-containing protein [Streptomyces wuyuanensis]|uniref:beta-ketoacyl synthase N-terminal-like domain-containing protein n=1 Tax=Streptomyces wuyuanensis TaxID=1196353 RepID=UPI00343FAC9E
MTELAPEQSRRSGRGAPVAVVGMAGRFPGADDVGRFWQNLLNGHESVREFTADEMRAAGVPEAGISDPNRVPAGADMAGADLFDEQFFGITGRDAALMDPQHRILLTCAWEALEDAGTRPDWSDGRIGVFAATSLSTYLLSQVLRSADHADEAMNYPVLIGNDKDFLATRVAYKLGLTGPGVSVATACSSSLTAVHLACTALERGDCDAALVGGVSITVPQTSGYLYQEGGILSQDGHCRVFDAASGGTVKGNGCGVVVLKPLDRALAEGDRVYAVIRGSAVNNDGSDKIGFTAPGPAGQQAVIEAALRDSGVPADSIGYVEAHGTGTALGDPLELRALAAAHRAAGGPAPDCAVGSLKANIGHLDAAAGVAGLIKTALVLHHQTVPPQINFTAPNPHIGLEALPYQVRTTAEGPHQLPLRAAAVSSFGLGGTNAHCVLEAAPRPQDAESGPPGVRYPVVLSGKDDRGLRAVARRLRDHLAAERPRPTVRDLAYTLLAGRQPMPVRHAFTAADIDEVLAELDALLDERADARAAADSGVTGQAVRSWLAGHDLPAGEWAEAWDFRSARKVALPAYPFRRNRHWIEAAPPAGGAVTADESLGADTGTGAGVTREQFTALLGKHLGVAGIAEDDDYYDLGGDSMLAVEIATSLRDAFGVPIDLDVFAQLSTVGELADYVVSVGAAPDGARNRIGRVVPIRQGEGRTLFLVHPAGGTNFVYFRMAVHSRSAEPLAAVSYPGEEDGRPGTLRELAALYVEQIRREQPHGPYRLGGYSFGGNVLFEMALQLRAAGEEVDTLLMLDSHPPEAYVGGHIGDDEFEHAVPLLLTSAAADEEQMELLRREGFVAAWRHNHDLLKGHYPDRRFDGDLVLVVAEEDEDGTLLDTMRIRRLDKASLWGAHVEGRVDVLKTPGDHFSMFEDGERLEALAATFDRALARIAGQAGGDGDQG